uniref:Aminotransferase-like plant mobile domain-containing protein n=1 Tax=Oryza glumipatula TaxID=40148 RepID=A0A0E0BQZ9_9ORYZ
MGFEHLLGISCDYLPKGLIIWLVKHFDVSSRTLILPNGHNFTINPFCVHQILGIPIGGYSIINRCDDDNIRRLIIDETKCKGSVPTINELIDLLTKDLLGDKFKRIFMLFAITTFLCPSSYDHASPDYFSAISDVSQISSYDWCGAVLDKIVFSIAKFKSGTSSTIGGSLLAFALIYFELLDTNILPTTNTVPRLQLWSTEIVKKYESIDSFGRDSCNYGRLPLKDINCTPFRRRMLNPSKSPEIPYELEQLLLAHSTISDHSKLRSDIHTAIKDMYQDIFNAIQPVVGKHLTNIIQLILPQSVAQEGNKSLHKKAGAQSNHEFNQIANSTSAQPFQAESNAQHHVEVQTDLHHVDTLTIVKPNGDHVETQTIVKPNGQRNRIKTICKRQRFSIPHLPVIDEAQLDNDNLISFSSEDIIRQIRPHHTDLSFDIPCNPNILDTVFSFAQEHSYMQFNHYDSSSSFDIRSLVSQELTELGTELVDYPSTQERKIEDHVNFDEFCRPKSNEVHFIKQGITHHLNQGCSTHSSVHPLTDSCRTPQAEPKIRKNQTSHQQYLQRENFSATSNQQEQPSIQGFVQHNKICGNSTLALAQREIFEDIINRIPYFGKSPRIIQINNNWVDHKTFGCCMQVYGRINKYVMDMMAEAVMTEQFEMDKLGHLPKNLWSRHIVKCDTASLFQDPYINPCEISNLFTEPNQGYKLDIMDMEDTKVLREMLTLYMITHRYNTKHNPETIAIMKKYGLAAQ